MKKWILGTLLLVLLVGGAFLWRGLAADPVLPVRVLDPSGAPVKGALLQPYAIRGSDGGHYFWRGEWADQFAVRSEESITDDSGLAEIKYPTYLVEGVRSVGVTFTAEHDDFPLLDSTVSVEAPLPTSAPLWARIGHLFQGVWHRVRSSVQEVQFTPGAKILASGYLAEAPDQPVKVYAQVSTAREGTFRADGWKRTGDQLFTARMPLVPIFLQLAHREAEGIYYFSEVQELTLQGEGTNVIHLPLRRGITVNGQLDASVPHPIRNGYASIRHVHGPGSTNSAQPLVWDDYTPIAEDGSFSIASMPHGRIEVIALCDGYLSTSPPGSNPGTLTPQIFQLTNEASITLTMQPTAVAAVKVLDPEGQPLPGAKVHFWPNERWAEWSATLIGTGWHRTGELLDLSEIDRHTKHSKDFREFRAETDAEGVALIRELPASTDHFAVEHDRFELGLNPHDRRAGTIRLIAGQTNYTTVKLQEKGAQLLE